MPLSERTRTSLAAIAEVAMPAGARLPAGGEATVRSLEAVLGRGPSYFPLVLASLARLADTLALRHGRRSIDAVRPDKRLALLEAWKGAPSYPARLAFKGLITTLKAAHYGSAEVLSRSGCRAMPQKIDEPAPPWMSQVVDLEQPGADEEIEAEVAVVGSGAGGGAAARALAERGVAVVILESGGFFRRPDFVGSVIGRAAAMYRQWGTQSTLGNVSILLPTGRAVGGTTVINSGTCLRVFPWVLEQWRRVHGVPLTEDELEPHFTEVEAWLGVERAKQPALGEQARIVARGAESLGFAHAPLPRNAPDCDGQGTCVFGCPTGAKRSADISLIPAALKAGAQLFCRATVESMTQGPDGVTLVARSANGRKVRVKARSAIVAAGALLTPLLLRKWGFAHPWLGKSLSIHPAAGAISLFPHDVAMDEAIPQGYGLESLREQGLLFEGAGTPFELTSMGLELIGPRLTGVLEEHRRLLTFGFNIRDDSRGSVRAGPGGQPLVTYHLNDHDVGQLRFGLRVLVDLMVRGGARTVFSPIYWSEEIPAGLGSRALDARALRASDMTLTAYHPLGTARMGTDPATSVVDMDLRLRGAPSILVCDGSVMPGSMGANPQVTIMALAARAAGRLADRLA